MIPQSVIDEILSRTSVSDLFSRYTEVKQSGKNTMALCPFHQEKTPSLSISEEKGLYHCFGCGASGNAISFLIEYRKMNFREAIEELAHQVGIDLSIYQDKDAPSFVSRKPLFDIHREIAGFYHSTLISSPQAEDARKYLQLRGLTKEVVERFQIGWGGNEWQFAVNYLNSKGYTKEVQLASGIAAQRNKGVFDRFKDRIIFPIFDREDHLVGFGGRILKQGSRTAKYLNTPETAIFHKGQLLFGLNLAKESIRSKGYALVVEGYLDVIALSQVGIANAVAPLGTSFTSQQLALLKRFATKIVFIFDGDNAGVRAANRALDLAATLEIGQRVLVIPNKQDPFDVVMRQGAQSFLNLIQEKSLSPIEFKLKFFAHQFPPEKDKLRFLRSVFEFIALNKSRVVQDEMLRKTTNFLQLEISVLLEEFERFVSKNKNFGRAVRETTKLKAGIPDTEAHLISLLLVYPQELKNIEEFISKDLLKHPESKRIFEFISQHTDKNTKELFSIVQDSNLLKMASEYAVMPEANSSLVKEVAINTKIQALHRQLKLNRHLQEKVQNRENLEENTKYLQQDQSLVEEIRMLEEKINHL